MGGDVCKFSVEVTTSGKPSSSFGVGLTGNHPGLFLLLGRISGA